MRAFLLILAALAGGFSSLAAAQPTERERRQAILPFVRTATNCIADAVRGDTQVLSARRSGNMRDIYSRAFIQCRNQITSMVQAHDRIYGPGTGEAFYTGPYVQDLNRAVMARIGSELDRREIEENERQQTQINELRARMELARETMYDCTDRELSITIRTNEPATVLADAAVIACQNFVSAMVRAFIDLWGARGQNVEISEVRNLIRQNVVASAVRKRADLANPQSTTQSSAEFSEREALRACIRTLHRDSVQGRLVENNQVISAVIELCRPEIESFGRAMFLRNTSRSLDEHRADALSFTREELTRLLR